MYVGKARTLEEWADLYEKKTGEKLDRTKRPTFYFPDKGFGVFVTDGDMIILREICGDGIFWRQIGEVLALERGFHKLGTICTRVKNIKAYFRGIGADITKEEVMEDNQIRYYLEDKHTKKTGRASPSIDGTKYIITWEV